MNKNVLRTAQRLLVKLLGSIGKCDSYQNVVDYLHKHLTRIFGRKIRRSDIDLVLLKLAERNVIKIECLYNGQIKRVCLCNFEVPIDIYYNALEEAWREYWGSIPPYWAPLEELMKYINKKLVELGYEPLNLEDHLRYVKELVKRGKVEYMYGRAHPEYEHWVKLRESPGSAGFSF